MRLAGGAANAAAAAPCAPRPRRIRLTAQGGGSAAWPLCPAAAAAAASSRLALPPPPARQQRLPARSDRARCRAGPEDVVIRLVRELVESYGLQGAPPQLPPSARRSCRPQLSVARACHLAAAAARCGGPGPSANAR